MNKKFWIYTAENHIYSQKEILKGSKVLLATAISCSIFSSPSLGGRIGLDKDPTLDLDSVLESTSFIYPQKYELEEEKISKIGTTPLSKSEVREIELNKVGDFSRNYKIPKEELEKTRLCSCLPHGCGCYTHSISEASEVNTNYKAQVWAKAC